jgi:glutamate synthase (NADPH/NADH) small chain
MDIEGRNSEGIHFAMDFLPQQNRRVGNESFEDLEDITADGKHVVVIGGGDTGSDCIGTSIRQGALSVTQLEIMPAPPEREDKLLTWPNWPLKMRTSSSQEEGADREFSVLTTSFAVENGRVSSLNCIRVNEKFEKIDNSEFTIRADLVLLAMGFVSPITDGIFGDITVSLDERGNVLADDKSYKTSHEKLWVAGDMRRGQSLVVWAIREGRQVAKAVDAALMGFSNLSE